MAGGQRHLHMTELCSAVTPDPPSAKFLLGGNCGFWSFIFSIFTENFDHWLPRLTNESADRVTCVSPSCPHPTRHPPRVGENLHNCGLWETRLAGRPTRSAGLTGKTRAGPDRTPSAPVSYGTVRLSVSLSLSLSLSRLAVLGSGYREFCGAGGDRLGLRQTDQSGSRLLGVRTLSHTVPQSHSPTVTAPTTQLRLSPSDPRGYQGLPGAGCDML